MIVRIYVEGGAIGKDSNDLNSLCRKAFSKLFEGAGFDSRKVQVKACGSRQRAFRAFRTALAKSKGEFPVLLVDSEGPVVPDPKDPKKSAALAHIRNREGDAWIDPPGIRPEHVHLMVECMEAWFLGDRDALRDFYGNGFRDTALPKRKDIEKIPKSSVFRSLKNASRSAKPKGRYDKGKHSFQILERIAFLKIATDSVSPYAANLYRLLLEKTA